MTLWSASFPGPHPFIPHGSQTHMHPTPGTLFFRQVLHAPMPPSFFPDPLPPFDINTSVGAFEVGTLVAAFLFGVTTVQVYLYFERYKRDDVFIKLMVLLVWLLELAHTVCICHALYVQTVTWYGQPELLAIPPISLDLSILINAFIGPIEQAWFTRRVYIFSRNMWLTGLCCLLSLSRLGATLAYASFALERPNIVVFELKYWWLLMTIVIIGSVNDFILALSLGWYLYKSKENSFESASRLLDRLIIWTIGWLNQLLQSQPFLLNVLWLLETSATTTVATLTMMICFFVMPVNFIYIGVYLCLAKIYANALMASLNARERFSKFYNTTSHSSSGRSGTVNRFTHPITFQFRSQLSEADQTVASSVPSIGRYDPGDPGDQIALTSLKYTATEAQVDEHAKEGSIEIS
ncbi:hypothetical protein GYMLUDRAFT_1027793 [Collybiopsis luxurians FD-317 M1]|nr:hypothetical protein GYMLUDRAFT_1027793 [Collybiopsis luxurians FD-317 M1]